jgi:hypothetical protein
VRLVLQLQKDEMHDRVEASTAPHFVQGDILTLVTKNIFLRGQPNRNLRDRLHGRFNVEEQIGKHYYTSKLLATIRLHHVFHDLLYKLTPSTVPVTTP